MYFLTGLLILLIILLFAPFRLHVYYLEKFKLTLGFLFFKIKLFPKEKKEKAEKKTEPEKKKKKTSEAEGKKKETKKEESKLSLEEKIKLAIKILKDIKEPFKKFFKKIKIRNIKAEVMVAKGDSAETAMAFTKINEAVTVILNLLDSIFTLKAKSIYVYPDFIEENSKYYFECDIKLNLLACTVLLVTVLKRSTKDVMKLIK